MDKNTRLLLLYSKLIHGEKVNKTVFCLEMDCLPRTFDRDISDLRIFLSESFSGEELIYDRLQNVYYLTGKHITDLEMMEYLFIERILFDTATLRKDELKGLVVHLLLHTANSSRFSEYTKNAIEQYQEPHNKALLKTNGDLIIAIRNKSVIKITYVHDNQTEAELSVIPCSVKYEAGCLNLICFEPQTEEDNIIRFSLDKIHSFTILRSQTNKEQQRVLLFNQKYNRAKAI